MQIKISGKDGESVSRVDAFEKVFWDALFIFQEEDNFEFETCAFSLSKKVFALEIFYDTCF